MQMWADENKQLIERFYAAFDRHDGDAMAACYTPNARFSDPAFPGLRNEEPGGMWRMLTERSDDLKVELLEHDADESTGTAHWRATYTFTQTGRPVVNDVHARFRFENGLIAEHTDDFSFHRWSRQALGTVGLLLGWTPVLRSATQRKARASLDQFLGRA
jgi:ketosteroid isomerase-like protein